MNGQATDGTDPATDSETLDGLPDGKHAGTGFAEALAMIARLPLGDGEKAEAVRRLLASGGDGGGGD